MAASPSGFWTNKSAVAGTFTTVALVGLAIVIGALFYIRRKRKASHLRNLSYSEKSLISDPRPYSTPSEHSSQDFSHEPMNAFAPSDPAHYPTYDPFSTGSAHHALYSGNASLPEITYSYAQDVNNQYPYYGDEVNNAPLPSSVTRSALQTSSLRNPFEPVPARNPFEPVRASRNPFEPLISAAQETTPVSRNSATYPPSVDDSFYGDSMDGRAL
ncbi:hypothetical protein GYMLUDRAFT_800226 [Collybiopsis luxurians FD-317 M1]|nr:hypothetical protein GYMLUDRAFT_800226 [Collybiopsis luxurians FD-317 M1]